MQKMEVENMSEEMELDLGALPPPTEKDAMWAWRLWNTLAIASTDGAFHGLDRDGGIWDMPGVGRFRRTGPTELTLTEIHASQEPDALGITMWNKHDWIVLLGHSIDWVVITDRVQKADDDIVSPDRDEPQLVDIGKIHVCPCGMIYSLLGPDPEGLRIKVSSEGNCLNPHCDIVVPMPFAGVLNSVNERAVIAKMEAQEMIAIAYDEDEGPPPIPIPESDDETPIIDEVLTQEEE